MSPPAKLGEKNATVTAPSSTATGVAEGTVQQAANSLSGRLLISTCSKDISGKARLEAFFSNFKSDDKVLIIISADPDAVASAVAIKRLLWRRVGNTTIASTNHVKRPDNVQLVEALKLKLESLSSVNVKSFSRLVIVDSQPGHSPQTERLSFNVVIDHHPNSSLHNDVSAPTFVDIRQELGATATMLVGYLKAAQIKPNQILATALFYAIKTDTRNFVRQGQLEDMKAFRWLYPFINPQLLANIEMAPIARSSYKSVIEGLNNAVFKKNTVYTFIPKVDHADTLVIVADFLIKIKEINQSIAAGICGNSKLVVIFRGGLGRLNMGHLAKKAFDDYGSAGGHKSMARAEVFLENLDPKFKNNPAALSRFVLRRLSSGLIITANHK